MFELEADALKVSSSVFHSPGHLGCRYLNNPTSDFDQVEYCIPDENTHIGGSQDMRKGSKKGVGRIAW